MTTKISADRLSRTQKIQTLLLISTVVAFVCSILAPSLYIYQLILAAGLFTAGGVLYQAYCSQSDVEHKNYWLKELFWMICTALAGIPFFLLCLPLGHRTNPDQLWVSSAQPLGMYTAPYVLPVMLFAVFLVLLYGAAKMSPTTLACFAYFGFKGDDDTEQLLHTPNVTNLIR